MADYIGQQKLQDYWAKTWPGLVIQKIRFIRYNNGGEVRSDVS